MKKPRQVVLADNDNLRWDQVPMSTTVVLVDDGDDDMNLVEFIHDDPDWLPFGLTRKEARQLRNFLNKCLEW